MSDSRWRGYMRVPIPYYYDVDYNNYEFVDNYYISNCQHQQFEYYQLEYNIYNTIVTILEKK